MAQALSAQAWARPQRKSRKFRQVSGRTDSFGTKSMTVTCLCHYLFNLVKSISACVCCPAAYCHKDIMFSVNIVFMGWIYVVYHSCTDISILL
jgi:hypothetical protein